MGSKAMTTLPSRAGLAALAAAAQAIAPTTAVGFTRLADGDRTSILYVYPLGVGGFEVPSAETAEALRPDADGIRLAPPGSLEAHRGRAAEAFLLDNQTKGLVSIRLAGVEPAARFWVGLAGIDPLTPDQLQRCEGLAVDAAHVLTAPLSADERLSRLERLEQAAELISALLHVLDVRDVIDRLSTTGRRALPHDLLLLNLFSEDLSTSTVYARSDRGAGLGMVQPNLYPAATIQAWTFSIVDDHTQHPMERDSPATKIGARSSLRFPVRFNDRVIGGVSFVSFEPRAFAESDVTVGKRLADHVASAVSHFRMAERLAEQARRTEELRAQTTNLELLDGLLAVLIDTGDLREVFDRASAIIAKVLPHDAAILMVRLPDGVRARLYASSGLPPGVLPDVVPVPRSLLDPDWDHDLVDETAEAGPVFAGAARAGFRSVLQVAIRLEGAFAGGFVIASRTPAAFKQADVLVARRIADRLALTLARDREVAAARRADEAAERAAKLEARVDALTRELDERTGYRRVIGESAAWRTDPDASDAGRGDRDDGAAARRIWNGQGSHRAIRSPRVAAEPRTVHRAQLRGVARAAARGGALRLRARRVHRGDAEQAGAARAGGWRHAVPRRGRRDEPVGAGQVPARAAGARVSAPRRHARAPHRRTHRRGHQPRPTERDRQQPFPRRPVLPAERVRDSAAAAARSARRHPAVDAGVPDRVRPRLRPPAGGHLARGARAAARLPLAGQHPRAAQRPRARRDSL